MVSRRFLSVAPPRRFQVCTSSRRWSKSLEASSLEHLLQQVREGAGPEREGGAGAKRDGAGPNRDGRGQRGTMILKCNSHDRRA